MDILPAHDLPFHLGSWQDAARQLRHGVYPQWDFAAALGAGEPRFVFYPPISWLLGAALSSFLTPAHAAESFILLALAASWFTMFATARRYTTSAAATLAAGLYVAGPYTVYNALERSAFGELLACAWLPLLFAAVIPATTNDRLSTLRSIALPYALLWLTNVPTAIIGSYLLVLLGLVRLVQFRQEPAAYAQPAFSLRIAIAAAAGLLLSSFFLLPALHQGHLVQLHSAFTAGQNYADNFLLHHTANTRRGNVHIVSLIAAEYMVPLALLLITLYARRRAARTITLPSFTASLQPLCFSCCLCPKSSGTISPNSACCNSLGAYCASSPYLRALRSPSSSRRSNGVAPPHLWSPRYWPSP